MATSNHILFALRDLGTSVRTIFQDEASRRQAALAAQSQENEQRRALESLRLTGEQQLARLGIEEAKTRFDIERGEAVEQRAQADEARRTQLFPSQLEAARIAPRQAEAGVKLTEAQTSKALADIELDKQKAADLASLHATQRQMFEEQRLGLKTEREARASLPTVSMATVEEALTASPNLSQTRKAFMLHFMESMRQKNQLSHTTQIRLDVGLSALDALNKYADILEGGDPKLVRDTASTVIGKMAESGVFKTGADAAAAVMDFTRIIQDPAYRQQIQLKAAETKKIYDRIVRAGGKDPAKVTQKEREGFEQQANVEYDKILQQRAASTTAPPPAAASPPLPALSGGQVPGVAPAPPPLRVDTPEYIAEGYRRRLYGFGDTLKLMQSLGVSPSEALRFMQPTTKEAINDAIRGNLSRPFTAEDVRRGVRQKEIVPAAAVRLLMEKFNMARDDAQAFLK